MARSVRVGEHKDARSESHEVPTMHRMCIVVATAHKNIAHTPIMHFAALVNVCIHVM